MTKGLFILCSLVTTGKLINSRYARAYLDFFEEELVKANGDWRKLLQKYMFEGDMPLATGITLSDCEQSIRQ